MTASALKSIEIALRANVTNFRAGIGLAAGDVKRFGQDLKKVGDSSDKDLKRVGQSAMIAGGAMVAGFALAQKAVVGFDQQISELGAVSGEAGAGLDRLRASALKAGADTSFSASQAAQAQVELAKAGISTADILNGGLNGALNLAAAGHLELGRAAEIAASAMTMFKLQGKDVPHIADLLAAGANKSAAEVEDMGAALQQSGLVASQLGLSVEDTTAAIAMFAQWGLKGSDAGTSLKTMLIALNPKSKEAAATMETLGLKFYDAEGKFVGITAMAEQLKTKMGGLTDEQRNSAMMTIFGTDAIRAAGIVYSEGGAGVDAWRTKVDDAGYASELAAKKLDNLGGDFEKLTGSLETTFITAGSGATSMLRSMAQETTTFVNGLGAMPAGMQQATMGFMGLAGGITFLGGAIATGVPKYQEMLKSLNEMGPAGEKMGKGVSFAANALMVATPGIMLATHLYGQLEERADEMFKTFTKGWKVPTSYAEQADQFNKMNEEFERLKKLASAGDGVIGQLKELDQNMGAALGVYDDAPIAEAEAATRKYAAAIGEVQDPMKEWGRANTELQHALGMSQEDVDALAVKLGVDLKGSFYETVPQVLRMKAAMDAGTPATQALGAGIEGVESPLMSVTEKFDALTNAMKATFDIAFGVANAQDQLQSKLNQLPEIMKNVQGNFNGTSDAAIAYREHMRGVATSAGDVVQQWVKQGIQGDELKARIDWLNVGILAQGQAWNVPKAEIDKYLTPLNEVKNTPSLMTNVSAPGAVGAAAQIGDITAAKAIAGQPLVVPVRADTWAFEQQVNQALAKFAAATGSKPATVDFRAAGLQYARTHGGYGVLSDAQIDKLGREHPNGYAAGTAAMPNGRFLVGEGGGPEIIEKDGARVRVTNAGQTRRILAGGGGGGGAFAGPAGGMGPTSITIQVQAHAPNYVGDQAQLLAAIASSLRDPQVGDSLRRALFDHESSRKGTR